MNYHRDYMTITFPFVVFQFIFSLWVSLFATQKVSIVFAVCLFFELFYVAKQL